MAQYQTSPQFTDDKTRVPRAEVLFQGPSALMGRCQNRGDGSKGQKEDDEIKERGGTKVTKDGRQGRKGAMERNRRKTRVRWRHGQTRRQGGAGGKGVEAGRRHLLTLGMMPLLLSPGRVGAVGSLELSSSPYLPQTS